MLLIVGRWVIVTADCKVRYFAGHTCEMMAAKFQKAVKTKVTIVGSVLGVVVFLVVVGIVTLRYRASALAQEGKAYVDEVLPVILADLRKETFLKYASPELANSVSAEQFDKIFSWFKKLGRLKEYKKSAGKVYYPLYRTQSDKSIRGRYVAHVEFESGPAQVQIGLVRKADKWQIHEFRINSPALIQ